MGKSPLVIPHLVVGVNIPHNSLNRAKELRKCMTPAEKLLWNELRSNKLSGLHFRRQQIIGRYFADFYCYRAGLIVELDGESHNYQKQHDSIRDQFLESNGLSVIRFSNELIFADLQIVLQKIAYICTERLKNERLELTE